MKSTWRIYSRSIKTVVRAADHRRNVQETIAPGKKINTPSQTEREKCNRNKRDGRAERAAPENRGRVHAHFQRNVWNLPTAS